MDTQRSCYTRTLSKAYLSNRLDLTSALKLHPSSLILADPVNKQYIRTIKKIQETIILFLNAQLPPPILRISDRAHIETLGLLPLLKLRCYKR